MNYRNNQNTIKKRVIISLGFLVLFAAIVTSTFLQRQNKSSSDNVLESPLPTIAQKFLPPPTTSTISSPTPTPSPSMTVFPATKTLVVPFTTQAPLTNWDAAHEDACEEASLIMVYHYLKGTKIADKNQADKEISDLLAYESEHGYGGSITLTQLAKIAKDYYGLKTARIENSISINDLKTEINAERPIIIPAAGKELHNPNFKQPGPNYHMLVVIGYDATTFITNDPGTRNGQNYKYLYDVLISATHDWDPSNIDNGTKSYLVFD